MNGQDEWTGSAAPQKLGQEIQKREDGQEIQFHALVGLDPVLDASGAALCTDDDDDDETGTDSPGITGISLGTVRNPEGSLGITRIWQFAICGGARWRRTEEERRGGGRHQRRHRTKGGHPLVKVLLFMS